jgi:hypothetical protein
MLNYIYDASIFTRMETLSLEKVDPKEWEF